jgi:putative endonuclease
MKAIRREKELKDSRREKKIELIESSNPKWRDLSYGWYQPTRLPAAQNLLSPS